MSKKINRSVKKTLINENEIITNNIINDENNLNNDNVDENKINLNEYKLKNMSFNGSSELISKLKPCYIDTDEKIIYSISLPCEKLLICKK